MLEVAKQICWSLWPIPNSVRLVPKLRRGNPHQLNGRHQRSHEKHEGETNDIPIMIESKRDTDKLLNFRDRYLSNGQIVM